MYIPTNTCQVAYTVVYIQNNINIYCIELELKKKKKLYSILSSVSVWSQRLIHFTSNVLHCSKTEELTC